MEKTYELTIRFAGSADSELRSAVGSWLEGQGVHSFVEGIADDLDLDPDYINGRDDLLFDEELQSRSPIVVYNFDRGFLENLGSGLTAAFEPKLSVAMREMPTEDWQNGWQAHFKPIFTEGFVVFPPWEREALKADQRVPLEIEPGMAFGTGQHESTQLCLMLLERLDVETKVRGKAVLDVGSGSGILAIAAAKLGAAPVWASDIELDAVRAADHNAVVNGVAVHNYIVARNGPMGPVDGPAEFPLIFANILLPVLIQMAESLKQLAGKDGLLILSGILFEQKDELLEAFAADFEPLETRQLNDWCGLLLRRKGKA